MSDGLTIDSYIEAVTALRRSVNVIYYQVTQYVPEGELYKVELDGPKSVLVCHQNTIGELQRDNPGISFVPFDYRAYVFEQVERSLLTMKVVGNE